MLSEGSQNFQFGPTLILGCAKALVIVAALAISGGGLGQSCHFAKSAKDSATPTTIAIRGMHATQPGFEVSVISKDSTSIGERNDDLAQDAAEAIDQYFDAIYGYVAYRLAPDFEAVRDVTQETFLASLQGRAEFRGNSSTLTWLRTIARNKVADFLRRQTTRAKREVELPDFEQLGSCVETSPSADVRRTLDMGVVMRVLPPHYVEILEAKYLDGLSVAQIAAERDTTEKAVESLLTRARSAFRTAYEQNS